MNINKALTLQQAASVVVVVHGAICALHRIHQVSMPEEQSRVAGKGPIVTSGLHIDFHMFQPTISRFQMSATELVL
jgi:hypothetical protein